MISHKSLRIIPGIIENNIHVRELARSSLDLTHLVLIHIHTTSSTSGSGDHYWGNVTGKFRDPILQNEGIMDLNAQVRYNVLSVGSHLQTSLELRVR